MGQMDSATGPGSGLGVAYAVPADHPLSARAGIERLHTAPGGYTTARSGLAMVADLWHHTSPEPANLTLDEWQALATDEQKALAQWCIAALRNLAEHRRR